MAIQELEPTPKPLRHAKYVASEYLRNAFLDRLKTIEARRNPLAYMRHDAVVEGVGETINQRMGANGICTFGLVDDEPAMVVMSGSAVWIMTMIDDDGDETPVLPTIIDSVRYAGIERGQTSVRTRIGERGDPAFIERIEFTHERIRLTFTFAHREQAEAQALLTALAALS